MIKNRKELEFVIFCVENTAIRIGVSAEKVYEVLTAESDILNKYIVPSYDVLHTQDKNYIIDDILEVMKERGVSV